MSDPTAPLEAASLRFDATGAVDAQDLHSPLLQELLRYWQSKCGAPKNGMPGRLPGRADIDPLELRGLLPNIYLIDVLPGDPDALQFRVRLLGEKHVEVYGPGLVGKVIDDIFPPAVAAEFNRLYAVVVRRREPVINRGKVSWLRNKEWLEYEGLHAPLASDGTTIDCIFGAGDFVGLD